MECSATRELYARNLNYLSDRKVINYAYICIKSELIHLYSGQTCNFNTELQDLRLTGSMITLARLINCLPNLTEIKITN